MSYWLTISIYIRNCALKFIFICGCITLAACKPASIQITPPTPLAASSVQRHSQQLNLSIIDARSVEAKQITRGELTGELVLQDQSFDLIPFLREHVAHELEARGFEVAIDTRAPNRLAIENLTLLTEREGQYGPFILWAALQGEWQSDGIKQPLTALVIKEHYPKLTYSELDKPLYSDALALLTKEVATKIAATQSTQSAQNSAADSDDASLASKTPQVSAIYQAGFSQDKKAVVRLLELSQHDQSSIRQAAIYGLGLLPAEEYFPTFTSQYLNESESVERLLLLRTLFELNPQRTQTWVENQASEANGASSDTLRTLFARTVELYTNTKR